MSLTGTLSTAVSPAELPGLVNGGAVPRSDSLLDQTADRECRPQHRRRIGGRRGSLAWARLAAAVAETEAVAQGRRNHNHHDHGAERQSLHGALLVPAAPATKVAIPPRSQIVCRPVRLHAAGVCETVADAGGLASMSKVTPSGPKRGVTATSASGSTSPISTSRSGRTAIMRRPMRTKTN
jgi:hypothetical protein